MQRPSDRPALELPRAGLLALFALLALAACGASEPAWEDDFPAPSSAAPAAPARPKSPPGRFARDEVDEVLLQGPARFLQRVAPEEVIRNGAFIGWRVVAMPNEWGQVALKPGDVVTRVNGTAIERPDDLWTVWLDLATARELRVAYERDGAAKELVMPIDGPPNDSVVAKLQSYSSPKPASQPKGTIVIEEPAPPPADGDPNDTGGGARESVSVSGGGKAGGGKDAKDAKDAKSDARKGDKNDKK